MRSIYTPQQETNSAYNPGVTYQGGQFLAQGIGQAGNAIAEGLQRYAANKEEAAALDTRFESTAKPLMEKLSLYGQLADENSPATALLDKAGDWHKLGNSQKKVLLADMLLLGDKAEADQRRKQDEQWKLLTAQHQAEMERLQGLSTGATVRHVDSLIAGEKQRQAEDAAVGQAIQRFATPQQVPDPMAALDSPIGSLARFANATRSETPEERRMAALAMLPGGRGSERVLNTLERYVPKPAPTLEMRTGPNGELITTFGDHLNVTRGPNADGVEPYWKSPEPQRLSDAPDYLRVPQGPNQATVLYAPKGSIQGQPIEVNGEQVGVGLPGRHGATQLRTGQVTQHDEFKQLADAQKTFLHLVDKAGEDQKPNLWRQIVSIQQKMDAMTGKTAGSAPAASPAVALPKVGEERKGYIYQGGDPSQPSSWKRK